MPGTIEVNSTFVIRENLPSDWNVAVQIQAETFFGFINAPSYVKEDFIGYPLKSSCVEGGFVEECERTLRKINESMRVSEYCKCKHDKGIIQIPTLRVGLELSEKRKNVLKKLRIISNTKKVFKKKEILKIIL